jgi:hypothetical protein
LRGVETPVISMPKHRGITCSHGQGMSILATTGGLVEIDESGIIAARVGTQFQYSEEPAEER